jgi:acetyl esterase
VLAVAYRLAPEHPYPAAFDDGWAALRWAWANAARLGAGGDGLAVAGDSAGAVIATTVALLARDARRAGDPDAPRVAFQALLYPPAAGGHGGDFPSRVTHAGGPTLTQRTSEYFLRHAFGEPGRAPDWRAAPLAAASLAGLPPALLQVAGHDPLRDEALAYGEALLAAGTPVAVVEYPGLPHGYVSMGEVSPTARLAQRQLADALRLALGKGGAG